MKADWLRRALDSLIGLRLLSSWVMSLYDSNLISSFSFYSILSIFGVCSATSAFLVGWFYGWFDKFSGYLRSLSDPDSSSSDSYSSSLSLLASSSSLPLPLPLLTFLLFLFSSEKLLEKLLLEGVLANNYRFNALTSLILSFGLIGSFNFGTIGRVCFIFVSLFSLSKSFHWFLLANKKRLLGS